MSVLALQRMRLMSISTYLLGLLLVVGLRLALESTRLCGWDVAPSQGIAGVCARGNGPFGRGHVGSGQG
jgi:hypothetical protein